MKVAYIIGPLAASSVYNRIQNIRRAEKIAIVLWSAGYAVICPHLNTGLLQGVCEEPTFAAGYLELLKRCDFAVVYTSHPTSSENSMVEIEYCKQNSIPVYGADITAIIKGEGRQ